MTIMKHKIGFTLSEVLLTLVIIGVIASLTIPSLMQNTRKQEYVTALKKAYSTLSQASYAIASEEGKPSEWIDSNMFNAADSVYKTFKDYLNIAADCGKDHKKCFGTDGEKNRTYRRSFILADGQIFEFTEARQGCNLTYGASQDVCAYIYVDINGRKKPNKAGRDGFSFILKADGIHPAGCDSDNDCSPSNPNNMCTCKIIRENAMNY